MPSSAALMRKTLRSTLQEQILPLLSGNETPLIALAQIPVRVPPGIEVRERKCPVLKTADARLSPYEGNVWEKARMRLHPVPKLVYVIDGVYEATMGLTDAMVPRQARKAGSAKQCGGYVFSIPRSAFFLRPANVPLPMSGGPNDPDQKNVTYITVRVLPGGALCTFANLNVENPEIAYSLLIDDDQLAPITDILINELGGAAANLQIVKALLLSFMLRLERGMSTRVPPMTDGLYSRFPSAFPDSQPLNNPLIQKIHAYIEQHLHQALAPADIAAHVRLSPSQVNRVLQRQTGMSIMAYATHQRMVTARLLLDTSAQSVEEVARLVGFQRVSHFSSAFRRFHGVSPLKFRQQHPPTHWSARKSSGGRHHAGSSSRTKGN